MIVMLLTVSMARAAVAAEATSAERKARMIQLIDQLDGQLDAAIDAGLAKCG